MPSVDCPFKDAATSDYVAIGVIGVKGRKRYILNVVNVHLDAGATEAEIRRQRDVHRPISTVLVEGKANGSAVVQRLKVNVPGVIEINPQGGKEARMSAAGPEWQAGDWLVDRNAGWTEPFIEQVTMFPNARNDDMADMTAPLFRVRKAAKPYTIDTGSSGFCVSVLGLNPAAFDPLRPVCAQLRACSSPSIYRLQSSSHSSAAIAVVPEPMNAQTPSQCKAGDEHG